MEKVLVTSALPYANGPIHLGHLSGAYLPADIYVRYKRLNGDDIIYVNPMTLADGEDQIVLDRLLEILTKQRV